MKNLSSISSVLVNSCKNSSNSIRVKPSQNSQSAIPRKSISHGGEAFESRELPEVKNFREKRPKNFEKSNFADEQNVTNYLSSAVTSNLSNPNGFPYFEESPFSALHAQLDESRKRREKRDRDLLKYASQRKVSEEESKILHSVDMNAFLKEWDEVSTLF
eukprot:NODE_1093_length_2245_cov_0.355545.p3 type:complete len:160 gc:universal NODE_1093_length_2245_cov_0.355545:1472-993(-)